MKKLIKNLCITIGLGYLGIFLLGGGMYIFYSFITFEFYQLDLTYFWALFRALFVLFTIAGFAETYN